MSDDPALADRVAPHHTAVLTMELQRGVVGDLGCIPALARRAGETKLVSRVAGLLRSARAGGVGIVHCTAAFRRDRAGSFQNVPMLQALLENPEHLVVGSAAAELVPELERAPSDLSCERLHGLAPFTGTALDALLRSLGVRTVVATGVSLNVGVLGLVIEAIGLGYEVVVPTDCVIGLPAEYEEQVLQHSLAHIATLTTRDRLEAIWSGDDPAR